MELGHLILRNLTSDDLRGFCDAINLDKDTTFRERCNTFVHKGRNDSNWAFNNIIRSLHYQKERVQSKEITAGTLHNYVKTIKMFCEVTDIVIPWKKITRGLPKGRMYADDRAPTLEEIHKIIEYPDRRMKPIVYTMGFFENKGRSLGPFKVDTYISNS